MLTVLPTGLFGMTASSETKTTNTTSAYGKIKEFIKTYGVPLYNKLDSFNGTPTEKNIDQIILLSLYFSEMEEAYTK